MQFTPSSLGYLSQVILTLAITIQLISLGKRRGASHDTSRAIRLFAGFFASLMLQFLLFYLDTTVDVYQAHYIIFLQGLPLALCWLFLLQGSFHFPLFNPAWQQETRLALLFSLSHLAFEAYISFQRGWWLWHYGQVTPRPGLIYAFVVVSGLWTMAALIRQTIYTHEGEANSEWWRRLLRPQGWGAQAARLFSLFLPFYVFLSISELFVTRGLIAANMQGLFLFVTISTTIFILALAYVNYIPEATSFMLKLVGLVMAFTLTLLSLAGWFIEPFFREVYPGVTLAQPGQSVRFAPNSQGGYDLNLIPSVFDEEIGSALLFDHPDGGGAPLDFSFPFFDQSYRQLFIHHNGLVTFQEEPHFRPKNTIYRYSSEPLIFAFYRNYLPPIVTDDSAAAGGVFVKSESERLLVTWRNMAVAGSLDGRDTFQLALYPNAVFEISYKAIETTSVAPVTRPFASASGLVGLLPGHSAWPDRLIYGEALPYASGPAGFIEDPYLSFRDYLSRPLQPFAYLIIASSLVIVFVLPIFFQRGLIRPLNNLLWGVRQVNQGDLEVEMPVMYNDEIGFLTQSFNHMVTELRTLVTDLETRVAERTAALAEQTVAMATLQERERIGRDLHDNLGQMMGYVNVQAQAVSALLEEKQIERATAVLKQLTRVAQEAHTDVRDYILSIRATSETERQDFSAALQAYLQNFTEKYGLECHLSIPPELKGHLFSPAVKTQLLGVIQEALTNVRKHAGVSQAQIIILQDKKAIQVVIADNGCGFDQSEPDQNQSNGRHFGLTIMRERLNAVGGYLEIRSAEGQGTQVIARLPWRHVGASTPEKSANVNGRENRYRVVLVDDHVLFLEGLHNMLTARGVEVVGIGHDGLEAQRLARELQPDIMVLDIHMPHCDGLEALKEIKAEFPHIKVVMLTVAADEKMLFEALRQGASGYLLKNLDGGDFLNLLEGVMQGELTLSPDLAQQILVELAQEPLPLAAPVEQTYSPLSELTARQYQILKEVAGGLTYKEIANALYISEATVKYHMGQILKQLQLKNRNQAAAYFRDASLSTPPQNH